MNIFIIMPFDKKFDDVYAQIKNTVQTAITQEGTRCYRLDEVKSAGRITIDLVSELKQAALCIADVTGNNPNVMWELGYAMALNKPTIVLSQSFEKMPFDIADLRTIKYDPQNLLTIKVRLLEAINMTFSRYEMRVGSRIINALEKAPYGIAVTGSSKVTPALCVDKIQSTLSNYIKTNTVWFVGSNGACDEAAAEYLGSLKQKVTIISYDKFDISDRMLKIIEKFDFKFLSAEDQPIPKNISMPSKRDFLFAQMADLMLIAWDGQSAKTQELINWCRIQHKDHFICYV
ncbi:MAG: nucleoside 2-deoxyribosyltransferase [Candidatus Bathyarchaeota archaeon]|nr:nucleoside 2-deoxyribosyltransferase [Candidatus Bathyarchaeota archaeon]